jgi:putative ABC transport system ATP-binding protein
MLHLENISIIFNKDTINQVEALKDVTLRFHEREWTYIIGGNGSGKSTLLRAINKEIIPNKGKITFSSCNPSEVLFIDQNTNKNLVLSMTVYENLVFGLRALGMHPNFRFFEQKKFREIISNKLKEFNVGLEKRIDEQVRFLSGGEKQIIVACRIMLSNPKVLLMDEFTSALDQKWAPFILNQLKQYVSENEISVLAVTHDFSQIQNVGDRIILLKNGRVVADKVEEENFNFDTQSILNLFYNE